MKKLILFFVIQLFNFNYAQIKDSAKVKEKNIDEVIIVASSRTQQN
jgi:hypothetical protein